MTAEALLKNGVYVGTAYYPEHWPKERWEADLKLMQEAEFNVIRVAEFAWVNLEPSEGTFEFEWLDHFLDLAESHNMHVILGTPTAIMPAWLAKTYPDALAMKPDGTRIVWGGRRHNCFSNEMYRRLAKRITSTMAHHFAKHPAVVGWQIDNELGDNIGGTDCRCDQCRTGFQQWLRGKYETLDELNRAWGNHFWGLSVREWIEVPIPDRRCGDWAISNPSASLDWQRFTSQNIVDFLNSQVRILRDACPTKQFVTHNLMGLHANVDYFELSKKLDFVSWDNYPPLSPSIPYDSALAADVMRGVKKKNFMIMEQTAGPIGWEVFSKNPLPGELRRICFQQIAHGADALLWFRWRTCTAGREQYWHGLLGHDGKPGRRFREASQFAKEFRKLACRLSHTTVHAQVAILYDYDSIWALQIQGGYPGASLQEAVKRYYRAFVRAGIQVDIVGSGDELGDYSLVLAPHFHLLPDNIAEKLEEYVRKGGVFLTDCRAAVKDAHNLVYERTLPGRLSPMLGIEIEEYESLRLGIIDDAEVTYALRSSDWPDRQFTAIHYVDWIGPLEGETGAEPIAVFDEPHLKSYAAVSRHQFGAGYGWYVGTIVAEEEFYDELVTKLLADAGIRPIVVPPQGVEAVVRSNDSHELLFLINHTDIPQVISVPEGKRELLTEEKTSEKLELDAFGVAVIEL